MKNFSPEYIRWCGMHTLNLGMVQFLLGSGLRLMLGDKLWGHVSDEEQLKAAFAEFDAWSKTHGIPHLDFKSRAVATVAVYIYVA